jgi:signal transduction histidine kinase
MRVLPASPIILPVPFAAALLPKVKIHAPLPLFLYFAASTSRWFCCMKKKSCAVIGLFWACCTAWAQQPYGITSITTQNGLPSNYIFDVRTDARGYVWAATDKGLCRYNGNRWQVWDTDNGLPGNYVNQILPVAGDGLWVGNAEKGTFYFDVAKNRFYPLNNTEKKGPGSLFKVGDAVYGQAQKTDSSTLYYTLSFDKKRGSASMKTIDWTDIYSPDQLAGGAGARGFRKFYDDRLLLTGDYLVEHNAQARPLPLATVFKNRTHLGTVQKFNGRYYFTNMGEGLAIIDSATQQVVYYNKTNGLPHLQITNVFVAANGTVYLSSFGGGIIVLNNKAATKLTINQSPIYQITPNGNNIYYSNDEQLLVQRSKAIQPIALAEPSLSFLVSHDTLFTGSFKGLHVHRLLGNKATLLKTYGITAGISSIFFSNGLLRLSTYGSGLCTVVDNTIRKDDKYPFANIEKAIVLPNGNIAALSYESGFYTTDGNLALQKHFTNKEGLPSNEVRDVAAKNDTLWAGCKNGIALIHRNKIIKTYTAANGLKGKLIKNIFFYNNEVLAVSNSHVHLLTNGHTFVPVKSFVTNNNEANAITTASLINGQLHIATADGIFIMPIAELLKTTVPMPPAFMYAVQNGDTTTAASLSLPHHYQQAIIYFGSLSSDITSRTDLWYKIDSSEWMPATDSNTVRFSKFGSGTYTLFVKSVHENGAESAVVKAMIVRVAKPWYLQWWALCAGGLLAIYCIFKLTQLYNQQKYKKELQAIKLQEELESERQRISRDLHDNMGAYTSALIANVQQLKTTIGENEQIQKMQTNAESILNSLRETIWVLNNKEITLTDFSDGFKNYCFKVLRNFEHINFEATETLAENPTLSAVTAIHLNKIMQEMMQNTIKHADATEITYTIADTDGIRITLADNGRGFDAANGAKGFGLNNILWRAREINFTIGCETAPGKGTVYTITQQTG